MHFLAIADCRAIMMTIARVRAACAAVNMRRCAAAVRMLSSSAQSKGGDGLTLKHFIANSSHKHKHKQNSSSDSVDEVPLQMDGSLPEDRFASHIGDRKFYIETYGCQMNVSDSEIVSSILMGAGYSHTNELTEADIVLANTCAVRDNAEQKIWHRLKYFEHLRKKNRKERNGLPYVGVLGCMAERLKTKLLEHSGVDFIVGPDAYRDIPRLLSVVAADQKAANVQLSLEETYADITPVRLTENNTSAFVSIMRGCNNMCSYCIVPFTRGRERSRPVTSIVDEIKKLRDQGVKEVMVLGQNVNSYHDKSPEAIARFPDTDYQAAEGFNNMFKSRHGGGMRFGELLADISDIDPELRIRFTSPHPKDFPDDVLQLIAERHNICNALHLPAQSGNSAMLERMRRGYTREAYLSLVERARAIIPDVGLSSDFIAGFCGETEEEHQDTLSLMRLVKYDQAFMYAYSRREKTHAAYHMEDDVPPEVKSRRLQEIVDTFYQTIEEKNRSYELGQLHLVLVEGTSKKSTAERPSFSGRADNNKRCVFGAVDLAPSIEEYLRQGGAAQGSGPKVTPQPGDYVVVRIREAKGHTLLADAVTRTTMTEFKEQGRHL